MLLVNNLNIYLRSNDALLLENFSFTLKRGDKIAVIGEEGDGKSTLLRVLCNDAGVFDYVYCTGSVERAGQFGYLAQFFSEVDGRKSVKEFLDDVDVYGHYYYLSEMNLDENLLGSARPLSSFSGGERVKLRLFKLLCGDPDTLFLDEPSNDLDAQTLEFLCKFISSCSVPVVFISHDETLLKSAANGIIHLEQQLKKTKSRVTVARTGFEEYLRRREEALAREKQTALKERAEFQKKREKLARQVEKAKHNTSWKNPDGIPSSDGHAKRFMQSAATKLRRMENERENLAEIPDRETEIIVRFEKDVALARGKRILELFLAELRAGNRLLAKDVALSVSGNTHVCIVGKNGAGKSTLLQHIYGRLCERGDIRVGFMPQDYARTLDFSQTPAEYLQANYNKETLTRAYTMLGNLNFTAAEMRARIADLSGGQQAKLIFLNMVLQRANVLVLDEPTRNFSPLSAPVVRAALKDFGGAIIAVSHDKRFIDDADVVYELTENGLILLR